jgi:Bacterial protein of unknown function (Gcw_chp)
MRALVVGGTIAALAAAVQPAAAQTTVGWDAAVFSSYVWRGVTYTNKPVLQPDLYVTFPLGKASFTAGGWANVDLGKYDNSSSISESGGTSAFNVAEFDWWGEFSVPAGKATLTAGATGYIFPNPKSCGCLTSDANTVEIYGKVGLDVPLSPQVNAYYDVDKVKGLYVEGSVSHDFPVGPKSLTLGALAGWTGGQEFSTSDKSFNFADKGLTHVDLSASMGFEAGSFSITPSIHGVITSDDATKVTKPNALNTGFKVWGGVTISWSKAFGGKAEE